MLELPSNFNQEIVALGKKLPLVIDEFEFSRELGKCNTTKLMQSKTKFPSIFSRGAPKFLRCVTTLFYPFVHPKAPAKINEPAVVNSIQGCIFGMAPSNENPNFIVLMFENADLALAFYERFYVTSIDLLALPTRNEIRVLCVVCRNLFENPLGNLLLHVNVASADINWLHKEVNMLNKNLRRNVINVNIKTYV